MVVYKNLQFPTFSNRAYFFSNFVTTIDGRAVIKDTKAYEPLGSTNDFETFLDLRKYADALIHGKHTAASHRTLDTRAQIDSIQKREKVRKSNILPYFVISNHPDISLLPALNNNPTTEKPYIVTHQSALVPTEIKNLSTILRFGEKDVCLSDFSKYLFDHNMKQVLVEGGPTLLGSFFEKDLIDEMFLTIAPKIINGKTDEFLTMNEGILIPPQNVLSWNLKSIKTKGNELFLRYQRNNS